MTLVGTLRVIHIAAGIAGLLLGPIAMWAPKRPGLHPLIGEFYFAAVTCVCISAAALAGLDWPRSAFFLPVAVGTYAFALPGYLASKRRRRGWLLTHAVGQASSYVAMATAFVVNNVRAVDGVGGIPFAVRSLVPMFVGTCLVAWLGYQVRVGNRPKP